MSSTLHAERAETLETKHKGLLSRRLRQLRIEAAMNQSEVGERVGLSRSAVTQIESGKREVSATELVRFASVFRHSPATLLADLGETAGDATPAEVVAALRDLGETDALRANLERRLLLAAVLTELETDLGADVYEPEAFAFRGANPRTTWEAAHQGYAAAEDERRRLDLGSGPIRDMSETLATIRVRTTRLALSDTTPSLFIHTPDTGSLIVVNETAGLEERRFWWAHGLAHVLFDRERRWVVCNQDERGHHHEVRANAFASRFLLPANGIERYLRSIGRDTMAQSLRGALELLSDTPTRPAKESRVHVRARTRRGAWQLNAYELSQLAHYFGVSTSLLAHALTTLRFLSGDERDRLTDLAGVERSDRARHAMRLAQGEREGGYDAFVSRLFAMAAEARRRGAISTERIEPLVGLLDLNEEEQSLLLGTADSENLDGHEPEPDDRTGISAKRSANQ